MRLGQDPARLGLVAGQAARNRPVSTFSPERAETGPLCKAGELNAPYHERALETARLETAVCLGDLIEGDPWNPVDGLLGPPVAA